MLSFQQRKELLAHCTAQNAPSSFYRKHYRLSVNTPDFIPATEQEWQQLPIVTKGNLSASTLEKRSFLPLNTLDHMRASSGTSGKAPLFSPRTHVRNMDYRLAYFDFSAPFLAFGVPMMPHWHEQFQTEHGGDPRVISYDPRYPEMSARLAATVGVEGVSLFAYHVRAAGDALRAVGIAERIRFLEVTGEVCSRALYEYMRGTFPNATIVQSYGASEVEDVHIGMPCRPMTGEEPLALYHPKSTHFLEIIDPVTERVVPMEAGVEGDLLITAYPGEPAAFPLIRFRIGDTIRIVESDCSHKDIAFTVLGRTELDFLKLEGGILRADEVERVLRTMPDLMTDEFELHRYERRTPHGPRTYIDLKVRVRPGARLPEDIGNSVATRLRVGPAQTYSDGVAAGRYLPLTCTELIDEPSSRKRQRLISHTD